MKKELLKGLTKEQIEKLNNCHTHEEILAVAKQEGIELNDEQLEYVTGGDCEPEGKYSNPIECPICHRTNTKFLGEYHVGRFVWETYLCLDCNKEYKVKKLGY